ncbi:hypothetical protein R3P38DRAFT_2763063 [Favolaschia claudopus]|uniref:Uncharacterized protein n=1 Tax=Favolaschia claudopus TaxID=2862362 RepID=A0AAW0DM72_9AGAR
MSAVKREEAREWEGKVRRRGEGAQEMGWRNRKKTDATLNDLGSQGNEERRHDAAGAFTAEHRVSHHTSPTWAPRELSALDTSAPPPLSRSATTVESASTSTSVAGSPSQTTALLTTLVTRTRVRNNSRLDPRHPRRNEVSTAEGSLVPSLLPGDSHPSRRPHVPRPRDAHEPPANRAVLVPSRGWVPTLLPCILSALASLCLSAHPRPSTESRDGVLRVGCGRALAACVSVGTAGQEEGKEEKDTRESEEKERTTVKVTRDEGNSRRGETGTSATTVPFPWPRTLAHRPSGPPRHPHHQPASPPTLPNTGPNAYIPTMRADLTEKPAAHRGNPEINAKANWRGEVESKRRRRERNEKKNKKEAHTSTMSSMAESQCCGMPTGLIGTEFTPPSGRRVPRYRVVAERQSRRRDVGDDRNVTGTRRRET